MLSMSKICTVWFLGLVSLVFLWAPFFASAWLVDNAKSPFNDDSDVWAADNIAILWTDEQKEDSLINVVRWWVNRVLWIMWLITLIILIYGWILMVTAGWNDERYTKWFTILKQAALWLILIGTAWFIASIIFWLIVQLWGEAWPADSAW